MLSKNANGIGKKNSATKVEISDRSLPVLLFCSLKRASLIPCDVVLCLLLFNLA